MTTVMVDWTRSGISSMPGGVSYAHCRPDLALARCTSTRVPTDAVIRLRLVLVLDNVTCKAVAEQRDASIASRLACRSRRRCRRVDSWTISLSCCRNGIGVFLQRPDQRVSVYLEEVHVQRILAGTAGPLPGCRQLPSQPQLEAT